MPSSEDIIWGPLYCPAAFPEIAGMAEGEIRETVSGRFIRREGAHVRQGKRK